MESGRIRPAVSPLLLSTPRTSDPRFESSRRMAALRKDGLTAGRLVLCAGPSLFDRRLNLRAALRSAPVVSSEQHHGTQGRALSPRGDSVARRDSGSYRPTVCPFRNLKWTRSRLNDERGIALRRVSAVIKAAKKAISDSGLARSAGEILRCRIPTSTVAGGPHRVSIRWHQCTNRFAYQTSEGIVPDDGGGLLDRPVTEVSLKSLA